MKIAIYETVHIECVIPLAQVLKSSSHSITFFVHQKMKNDIESSLNADVYEAYKWFYLGDQNILPFYKFLNRNTQIHRYDLFWLNTIESKHLAFTLLKLTYRKMKLLINVHEINNFFKPTLSFRIKGLVRYAGKKILAAVADSYIFNADKMKENITERKLTQKKCYVISPVFYDEPANEYSVKNKFTVVIAGTVDERRRDYKAALLAWKHFIFQKDPAIAATLILAGATGLYGTEIIDLCRNNELLRNSTKFFETEIAEVDFQQILANASVLLSPQNIQTSSSDNITEEYGITKTSGNTYDAIRHGKPYIVPKALTIPASIESSAIRYTDIDELGDIFKKLSANKALLDSYYKKAIENSQKFSFENMRQKVSDTLADVFNS